MRLLTCHIENFGKLSDFSYDFADGYNAFVLPNGAGKSTFAAFIRVMFYGFAGETKRTELEKERKRYLWRTAYFYSGWEILSAVACLREDGKGRFLPVTGCEYAA